MPIYHYGCDADVAQLSAESAAKKGCYTSDVNVMDTEDVSDEEIDAEEELESTCVFIRKPFSDIRLLGRFI